MPKAKKVVAKPVKVSQFDEPNYVPTLEVECKHQNQGEGKCFDCGLTIKE